MSLVVYVFNAIMSYFKRKNFRAGISQFDELGFFYFPNAPIKLISCAGSNPPP